MINLPIGMKEATIQNQEENKRVLSQISKENPHYELVYRIHAAPGKK